MNQLLCKLSSHAAGSWLRMGTASCANAVRHATHISAYRQGFHKGEKKLERALQEKKKIPFLQINGIGSE